MATENVKIVQADYNNFYSNLYNTLGAGSGQSGYGQTLNFSPTFVTTSDKIKQLQWGNLRTDIIRIAAHQGLSQSPLWSSGVYTSIPVLPVVDTNTKISAATITAYQNAFTIVTDVSNKYKLAQYSDELLIDTDSSRRYNSSSWNASIRHHFTVSFSSAAHARYFFNAGGSIRINPVASDSYGGSLNDNWVTLVNGVGTFAFNYTNFYNLTSSAQTYYQRTGNMGNAVYASNDYLVLAYCNISNNSSGGATSIYFECIFSDDKTTVDPTWGTDENVNVTFINNVRMYRPTEPSAGAGVVVSAPSGSTTVRLDSSQVADPYPGL